MGTARPLVGVTKARPHPVEHLDHPRGHLYDEPASLVVERSGERFRVELVVLLDVRSDVPVPVFGAPRALGSVGDRFTAPDSAGVLQSQARLDLSLSQTNAVDSNSSERP
jgi:hypothetical protein